MRKQNRIISLVIVLALLLSMLAAFAQVGAEGEADPFVPTATAEALTGYVSGNVIASTEGNLATNVSSANWKDEVLGRYLWTEAGENQYISLTALADKSTANHFFMVATKVPTDVANKISFVKDGDVVTASGYYVIDFDYASETGYPTGFFVSPNIGYPGHSSYTQRLDPDFSQKRFADQAGTADGNWHHYTLVGDLTSNKAYVYVDGAFVADLGVAYAPSSAPDYTQEYYLSSFRIEVCGSVEMGTGNILNVDNLSARTFAEDASLASALEAKDITAWDKNAESATGSLPAIANIDGVETNKLSALQAALATSDTSVNVEILRDFSGTVTVDRPAVVNTHGLTTGLVPATGVKTSTDGDVITYTVPYRPSMTVTTTGDATGITKFNAADNLLTSFGFNNVGNGNNNTENGRTEAQNLYVTNNLTGDKYVRWDVTVSNPTNVFAGLNSNTVITYESGVSQYMVYDFDYAYLSGGANFNASSVCRKVTEGTGGWGANAGGKLGAFAATWAPGVFHHVTVVMDFQTNDMIIYIDNAVALTIANGIMAAGGFTTWQSAEGNQVNQEALRIGQNQNQNVALDNLYVRHIKNDESLASAITAKDLSGWTATIFNESYVMPECAPIAQVNGDYVYAPAQLAEKLALKGNNVAEIMCDISEEVIVNGDAVIETHELVTNLVCGEGVTSSTEGSVITFDAPFRPSETTVVIPAATDAPEALSAIGISGIKKFRHVNSFADAAEVTVVTDTTTGNQYLDFRSIADAAATTHRYFEAEVDPIAYKEDHFIVIDFDLGAEYEVLGHLYIQFNSRTSSGPNATKGSSMYECGFSTTGEWAHMTIIADQNTGNMYFYVNNTLVRTAEAYAFTGEVDSEGNVVDANGNQISLYGVRFNLNVAEALTKDQNLAFDNMKIANVSDEWLVNNSGAESIEGWAGRTYKEGYELPVFPVVANVDGVDYTSIPVAEAALADGGEHTISIERDFPGAITVDSSAAITTNGFAGKVAPAAPKAVTLSDGSLLLQATIVTDNGDGTLAYLQTNESNYAAYTAGIMWIDEEGIKYEQIYYTFGTTVEYVGTMFDVTTSYIQNGQLIVPDWTWYNYADEEQESLIGKVVVDKSYDNAFYAMPSTRDAGAANIKYNLSLYSNFVINLYVPVSISTNTSDTKVEIGGVEYYVFEKAVDATNIANIANFDDVALTVDGQDVTVDVPVSILTYAEKIFANESYSEQLKQVIYAALEYANEASKALVTGGADVEAIADILNANSAYATADAVVGESADYSALVGIVESARLKLDAQPEFVIKMSTEYVGTVTVSYVNFTGETVTATFESNGEGEEFVIKGMKVYEFANTLTIKAGEAVGEYSLETYINGITEAGTDSAFATALLDYAKLALAYKELIK